MKNEEFIKDIVLVLVGNLIANLNPALTVGLLILVIGIQVYTDKGR